MKRFHYFLMAITMLMTATACSENDIDIDNDMPDDELVFWDIYPVGVKIQLVDEAGNNLLDPEVNGNWVDEPMWMGWNDKSFHVIWKRDDLPTQTRMMLPRFYGAVWSGVWIDQEYSLYFGQFAAESSQDLKLTFGITAINTVYELEYSHRLVWENKEPHFDDHITYNGKRIEGNKLTLVLPKNNQ